MKSAKERRKHPRLSHRLPIKIATAGYDFTTATKNVSCVGTYCSISKYIPPFTKVLVKLSLPIKTENGRKDYAVECKGVIVRTEDDTKSGFNIAIFFNDIKESQRKIISRYINQFFPAKSSA